MSRSRGFVTNESTRTPSQATHDMSRSRGLGTNASTRTSSQATHDMSRSRGFATNDATRTADRLMTRKVLVVDDDAAILEVLTMRLGAMGFDVTPVGEPRRALEAAAVQRFDLALIDLRMGPMDGVQLMEALHAQQRRLPVLIMTAHGAIDKGVPITRPAASDTEAGTIVAAPLVVQRGPTGALVIETPTRVEPTEDDLELLALFSSQAAIAVRNTHELERLRSGALAALGRMATQVAHEIKNPLAGLRLYARHLDQRLGRAGDTEGRELAGKIAAGVEHLADVVAEITAFGRPPELHRAPTNVHAILDECLELAAARFATPAIEVVRGWDPACPEALLLDPRELRKAFLNLIVNAFEALDGSGRLTLTTSYAADSGMIAVMIEDTGVGMSDETISRAFDLFYTTKPDGTGLGMSIARSVVQLHGGELSLQSRLGHGTRVQVRLPVVAP